MAMILFLFLIFILFLIALYFVLMKIANPIDKQVKKREFERKHIEAITHDIAIKQREIDALSRSTGLKEEKKQAEKELKELQKLHKDIMKNNTK